MSLELVLDKINKQIMFTEEKLKAMCCFVPVHIILEEEDQHEIWGKGCDDIKGYLMWDRSLENGEMRICFSTEESDVEERTLLSGQSADIRVVCYKYLPELYKLAQEESLALLSKHAPELAKEAKIMPLNSEDHKLTKKNPKPEARVE